MRRLQPNTILLAGVVFFLVGGLIVYIVLGFTERNDDRGDCSDVGGVAVESADQGITCIDPEAVLYP